MAVRFRPVLTAVCLLGKPANITAAPRSSGAFDRLSDAVMACPPPLPAAEVAKHGDPSMVVRPERSSSFE